MQKGRNNRDRRQTMWSHLNGLAENNHSNIKSGVVSLSYPGMYCTMLVPQWGTQSSGINEVLLSHQIWNVLRNFFLSNSSFVDILKQRMCGNKLCKPLSLPQVHLPSTETVACPLLMPTPASWLSCELQWVWPEMLGCVTARP